MSSSISIKKRRNLSQQKNLVFKQRKKVICCDDINLASEKNSVCQNIVSYTNDCRLPDSFYHAPCIDLAKKLLGKVLVRRLATGDVLKGRIVETESYLGTEDKASHSYQGRKTERNGAMFLPPGTAYVYSIYGMYHCFNVSSLEEGSAVLIRALHPLLGASTMEDFRSAKRKSGFALKEKDLCNGPSKLCQALKIDKSSLNKVNLGVSQDLWLEEGCDVPDHRVVSCKRIGIESAGEEWANKPLRFYVRDCFCVSVRNKVDKQNTKAQISCETSTSVS